MSALFLLEKSCSSSNRLIWGFGKQPRLSIIGDSGSLTAFCAHLCTSWQKTLENCFPLPVSQYPHLKIISVFLIVFEMHEELNIITLTSFYTRTSHGGKQAEKPITLQFCRHAFDLCFKIPAFLSSHSEEHLNIFRGNPLKSKNPTIERNKDRVLLFFQQSHLHPNILCMQKYASMPIFLDLFKMQIARKAVAYYSFSYTLSRVSYSDSFYPRW